MRKLFSILPILLASIVIIALIFVRCSDWPGDNATQHTQQTEQTTTPTGPQSGTSPTDPDVGPIDPSTTPTGPNVDVTKPSEPKDPTAGPSTGQTEPSKPGESGSTPTDPDIGQTEPSKPNDEVTRPTEPATPMMFIFTIDGVECYFGMQFSEVLLHFSLSDNYNENMMVAANESQNVEILNTDGDSIMVSVYNNTGMARALKRCSLGSVDIDIYGAKGFSFSPTAKSLGFDSTLNDFTDILGNWLIEEAGYGTKAYAWLWTNSPGQSMIAVGAHFDNKTKDVLNIYIGYESWKWQ